MSESPLGNASRKVPEGFEDPDYLAAVVDLLGAIAYGEMSAFERLAEDAKMAPTLADKSELARMAATEFGHFEGLCARLSTLGAQPYAAMEPFVAAFEAFHRRTAPSDWLEGLVKAYVGDGLAADFYREVAEFLDGGTKALIVESMADAGQSAFVVAKVRAAIEEDHRVGGRLALWGRRLMGEALAQAQRVTAERDALSALLAGDTDRPGMDLAAIGRLFARITENHSARMDALGLAP
ncbi:MAG TPA: ferritin-like fold-containing protein [Nocardioidaceae bacterium]|nr:ferritin-like fold-containing protein [Nocardioidaceae bacterium]